MLHVIHDPLDDLFDPVARFSDATQDDRTLPQLLFGEMAVREREIGRVEEVALSMFVDAQLDALFFLHEEGAAPSEEGEDGCHGGDGCVLLSVERGRP